MKNKIKDLISTAISEIDETDIYTFSLYVSDENDNPCKPTVTFGFNTERKVQSELENASDEQEARWNYAFWLQNNLFVFGVDDTAEMVKQWLIKNNLPFYDDDAPEWENEDTIEKTESITKAFIDVLIETVKEIHSDGLLQRNFGRDLPILIHELEYYDEIAEQNIKANGKEIIEDFVSFCLES